MFNVDFHEIIMDPIPKDTTIELEVNAHELRLLQDKDDNEEQEQTDGRQVENHHEDDNLGQPVVLQELFLYDDSEDFPTKPLTFGSRPPLQMLPQVNEGDLLQLGALMDDNTVTPSVPLKPLTLEQSLSWQE